MIYEDGLVQIHLLKEAAGPGHVQLQLQDQQPLHTLSAAHAQHVFTCASLVATALFETMGAHGTNIVLQEDDASLQVDVYARTQEDGLGLQWAPEPGDQGALEATASKVKDAFWYVGKETDAEEARQEAPEQASKPSKEVSSGEDYRVKQLRRSP